MVGNASKLVILLQATEGSGLNREKFMKLRTDRVYTVILLSLYALAGQAAAKASPTATTLAVTSDGARVSSVPSGSVVALTATVKASGKVVTAGQVSFCNASAKYCTDINLVGTAQLTSAGTAVLKFVPGIGKHSYKAAFAGTPNAATDFVRSTSRDTPLTVTGKFPTATTITASGQVGDYTLTATASGLVNATSVPALAGKVSFLDTTDGNRLLGKAGLGTGSVGLSFPIFSQPATNPYAQSVAVADFNGDGKLDLIVPVYSIFTSLSDANVLLGNGDGTFTPGPAFPLTGQNVNNAAVADFNGDGQPDLAISLPDAGQVQVLLGNGNGTFKTGATAPVTGGPSAVAVGDFNGDGKPDLAVVTYNTSTVTVLLGNGDGSFTQVSSSPQTGFEPASIAAGDFNGDGILDLAVTNLNDGNPEPGSVTVLLGNGDGTFTPTAESPVTGAVPLSIAVADFNGDGKADLVTGDAGSNTATVLLGNGDGTFAGDLNPPAGVNSLFVAVGDFNGDGLPDLAAANNTPYTVTILLSEETQTATATATGIAPAGSGQHLVDASYKGNGTYLGSVSPTIPLTGNGAIRP